MARDAIHEACVAAEDVRALAHELARAADCGEALDLGDLDSALARLVAARNALDDPVDSPAADPDPWIEEIIGQVEETAARHHPRDVPYYVAGTIVRKIGLNAYSVAEPLARRLLAISRFLESLEGPAPLPLLATLSRQRRPAGAGPRIVDDAWRTVRLQVLITVKEHLWRAAAGNKPGIPYDVELTHDVASFVTEQLAHDPVFQAAGANFVALPEFSRLGEDGA